MKNPFEELDPTMPSPPSRRATRVETPRPQPKSDAARPVSRGGRPLTPSQAKKVAARRPRTLAEQALPSAPAAAPERSQEIVLREDELASIQRPASASVLVVLATLLVGLLVGGGISFALDWQAAHSAETSSR